MAIRPVYTPRLTSKALVIPIEIEFQWFPGFSITQKQKSIACLHAAAAQRNIANVLEISSKSPDKLGTQLSAFNLQFPMRDGRMIYLDTSFLTPLFRAEATSAKVTDCFNVSMLTANQ